MNEYHTKITNLRFYKDSDYKELIKILKEGNLYDEIWEAEENLKRKITKDFESIIVYQLDKQIVGCVFIVEDGWNGFIWRLSVRKKYRKQGIGVQLMEFAEKIIKQRGIKESSLFVDCNNEELKEWYKKQKYQGSNNYTFMYKKLTE